MTYIIFFKVNIYMKILSFSVSVEIIQECAFFFLLFSFIIVVLRFYISNWNGNERVSQSEDTPIRRKCQQKEEREHQVQKFKVSF